MKVLFIILLIPKTKKNQLISKYIKDSKSTYGMLPSHKRNYVLHNKNVHCYV